MMRIVTQDHLPAVAMDWGRDPYLVRGHSAFILLFPYREQVEGEYTRAFAHIQVRWGGGLPFRISIYMPYRGETRFPELYSGLATWWRFEIGNKAKWPWYNHRDPRKSVC